MPDHIKRFEEYGQAEWTSYDAGRSARYSPTGAMLNDLAQKLEYLQEQVDWLYKARAQNKSPQDTPNQPQG